jgi:molybdenum cofactor guanylyltransferase
VGETQRPPAIGAVLAGGASARMGAPKATVELDGRPLILYPLRALEAAGLPAHVVAKRRSDVPPGVRVWLEPDSPSHPLLGIVTALRQAATPVVVLACDLPFATPELVELLAGLDAPAAVPSVGGRLHGLAARYEPSVLSELERALDAGRSLRSALCSLQPRLLTAEELRPAGDPELMLFNVNGPADLERARELLRSRP